MATPKNTTPNQQAEAEAAWAAVIRKREVAHKAVAAYRRAKKRRSVAPEEVSAKAIVVADEICAFLDATSAYNSKYPPMIYYTSPAVDAEFSKPAFDLDAAFNLDAEFDK